MGLLPAANSLGTLVLELTADGRAYLKELKACEGTTKDTTDQIVKYFKYASLAVAATVAAIATAAIHEFAEFDAAMSKSLSSMRGVTGNMRKDMEATARSLAKNGVEPAEEIAKAYEVLARNGLDASQAIGAIVEAEKFATATRTDLIEATNTLAGAQLALGLVYADSAKNAEAMAHLSDVLITAQREGSGTASQYADALRGKLAVVLKSTGKSVEEGTAAVMVLNRTFRDTGESAAALSLTLQTMQDHAVKNKELWKQFGLEIFDASGHMKSISDISGQFNKLLGDMTDKQKEQTLSMLGFNMRTFAAVQALAQAGDQVKRFETTLQSAKGITEEMAETRLKGMSAQAAILKNNMEDLLLTIGEQLLPIVKALNTALAEFVVTSADGTSAAKAFGENVRDIFITVLALASDVIDGWKIIVKAGQIAIGMVMTIVMNLLAAAAEGIQWIVARAVDGINVLIKYWDKLADKVGKGKIGQIQFGGFDFAKTLRSGAENTDAAVMASFNEMGDLLAKGKTSDKIIAALAGISASAKKTLKPVVDAHEDAAHAAEEHAAAVAVVARKYKETDPEVIEFRNSIKYTWEDGLVKLGEYKKMLDDGVISMADFTRATEMLNLPFMHTETGNQTIDQMEDLKRQTVEMELEYKKQHDIAVKFGSLTNAQLEAMEKNHLLKTLNFEQQRKTLIISSGQTIADSLTGIAENLSGKQSGIYKAMFAVSKAFAIAQSIVDIQTGIAQAAALPYPANLAAMASVAAATASIVSNIQAVGLSFEGGGVLPGSSRSGGVDGRGGMMMIGHPGEVIIDPQNGGRVGGGGMTVNIINQAPGIEVTQEKRDDGRTLEVVIRKTSEAVASDLRKGGGPVSNAIESAYGVRRGRS